MATESAPANGLERPHLPTKTLERFGGDPTAAWDGRRKGAARRAQGQVLAVVHDTKVDRAGLPITARCSTSGGTAPKDAASAGVLPDTGSDLVLGYGVGLSSKVAPDGLCENTGGWLFV